MRKRNYLSITGDQGLSIGGQEIKVFWWLFSLFGPSLRTKVKRKIADVGTITKLFIPSLTATMTTENQTDVPLSGQLCLLGRGLSATQKACISRDEEKPKTAIGHLH